VHAGQRGAQIKMTPKEVVALREKLGMTQEELAEALGMVVSTINRWEGSKFRPSKLAVRAIRRLERKHE